MYSYIWIEGEKALMEFCQKRFKDKPRFCETIGHCRMATIHLVYKYRDENDTRKGCAQMFFLYMEHSNGKYYYTDIEKIERWTYEQIRADRSSIVKR
jgi:hypothetical protein